MNKKELQAIITLKDRLSPHLKGLRGKLKVFAGEVARLAKYGFLALAGAVTAAGLALKNAVQETVRYGVEIDKVSKQTGMTVEEFQRLAYAAEQEHASIESITKVLPIMAKYMEYARQGQVTYRREFDKMGISVTNARGELKSTYEVLLEMSDFYATAENKTQALAIATTLLGRRGAELVPLLKLGRKGIQELGDEAAVMSGSMVAATKVFSDRLRKIQEVIKGVKMRFTEALLPVLDDIAERLSNIDWDSDKVREWAKNTAIAVLNGGAAIAEFAVYLVANIRTWMSMLQKTAVGTSAAIGLVSVAMGRIDIGTLTKLKNDFKELIEGDKDIKKELAEQLKGISDWKAKYSKMIQDGLQRTNDLKNDIKELTNEISNVGPAVEETSKFLADYNSVLSAWGENIKSWGTTVGEAVTTTMDGISSGTAKAFRQALQEGKDFGESMRLMFQDLLFDILEMIIKSQINQALAGLMNFGGAAGGGGLGGGLLGGVFGFIGSLFGHDGGMVTKNGIQRFHNGGFPGLRNDEVPAILQTGERVLNRRETKEYSEGRGNIEVRPVVVIQAWDSKDVSRNIKTIGTALASELKHNSPFRQAIKQYA